MFLLELKQCIYCIGLIKRIIRHDVQRGIFIYLFMINYVVYNCLQFALFSMIYKYELTKYNVALFCLAAFTTLNVGAKLEILRGGFFPSRKSSVFSITFHVLR